MYAQDEANQHLEDEIERLGNGSYMEGEFPPSDNLPPYKLRSGDFNPGKGFFNYILRNNDIWSDKFNVRMMFLGFYNIILYPLSIVNFALDSWRAVRKVNEIEEENKLRKEMGLNPLEITL